MSKIVLDRIDVVNNKIKYGFFVEEPLRKYYNLENTFSIEYSVNEKPLDISNVPDAVLAIPFVCNVLPIIWITDSTLFVPELDEDFLKCIAEVKKGYETMYPETEWKGKVEVGKIIACDREAESGKCAMFYSGGVDSVQTLISHLDEKPMLISIWGSDVRADNVEGWNVLYKAISEASERFQLPVMTIRSTFREFDNEGALDRDFHEKLQDGWWHGVKHGIALLGHVAPLAYLYGYEKMYIASSNTAENGRVRCASDPLIDNHVRFVSCKVYHDGYSLQRQKKIGNIVRFSEKQGSIPLHVCWKTQSGINCCHCEKCYRTIAGILVEGGNPGVLGFSGYQRWLKQMRYVVLKEGTPYLFRVEWTWIKKRLMEQRLLLKKSSDIKHLKWILKTDFDHPEKIKLPLTYRIKHAKGIRGKLGEFKFYQALHKIKKRIIVLQKREDV